jgi:cyanophycin synthetase
MLAITARLIFEEAKRRGWQVEALDEQFLHTLKITLPGEHTYYFDSCQPPLRSASAMSIANNKLATYIIAKKLGVPVADFCMVQLDNLAPAQDFLAQQTKAGQQVVVKPIDTNHGDGITVGITTQEALADALDYAQTFSKRILLQRRHYGGDCRVLVVNGKVVAAAQRVAAYVVGDGTHTVRELIELKNNDKARGTAHDSHLSKIDLEGAERYLGDNLGNTPLSGEHVTVLGTANLSRGGEAHDITDDIHPSFKEAAARIATALDMFICGVDFMAADYTKSLTRDSAILLEINATPGLRMHHYPSVGVSRNVAKVILDEFERKIASTNN